MIDSWDAADLKRDGSAYGQHVCFLAGDQHVHQLYYDNARWHDQDLTGGASR